MGFCVDSPMGLVKGNFHKFKGGMALEGPFSQTVVSIETDSLETEGLLIEDVLKSDEFFDANNFPDIILSIEPSLCSFFTLLWRIKSPPGALPGDSPCSNIS